MGSLGVERGQSGRTGWGWERITSTPGAFLAIHALRFRVGTLSASRTFTVNPACWMIFSADQDGVGICVDAKDPALPALCLLLPQNLQQFILLRPERIAVQGRRASDRDESPVLIGIPDRFPVVGIIGIRQEA